MEMKDSCPYCNSHSFISIELRDYKSCQNCGTLIRCDSIKPKVRVIYNKSYQNALGRGADLKVKNFQWLSNRLKLNQLNNSILDFGCGSGAIVHYLRAIGNRFTHGYDPYSEETEFKSFPNLETKIEYLFLFDVIEHLENFDYLEYVIKTHLKAGSKIIITTPISTSLWLRCLGNFWPHLNVEHLTIAGSNAFELWAKKIGSKVIDFGPLYKRQSILHILNSYFKLNIPLKYDIKFKVNSGEAFIVLEMQ